MKPFYFALIALSLVSLQTASDVQAQPLSLRSQAKTPMDGAPLVYMVGEVLRPGAYQVPVDSTWGELLDLAGGVTNKADLNGVKVFRGSKTLTINHLDRHEIPGFAFEERDIVVVPKIKRILITGAVKRPGNYPFPADRPFSVQDALKMAGGMSIGKPQKGIEPEVTLRRWEGQPSSLQVLKGVPLDQLLQSEDEVDIAESKAEARKE